LKRYFHVFGVGHRRSKAHCQQTVTNYLIII